jgi:acyl-CoA reductase-like NAD-dependent aldehyde dehydrogenase
MKSIIELAREAGFPDWENTDSPDFLEVIKRFAHLVRAAALEEAERECYRVGANAFQDDGLDDLYESGINSGSNRCAAAIRALKEKT